MTHNQNAPAPIEWAEPPSSTSSVTVPFELLEQSRRLDDDPPPPPPSSPFDVAGASTEQHNPSRNFGVESTGEFRLDDFLSATGDVLLLGDPLDIASTAVLRSTIASGSRRPSCIKVNANCSLDAPPVMRASSPMRTPRSPS